MVFRIPKELTDSSAQVQFCTDIDGIFCHCYFSESMQAFHITRCFPIEQLIGTLMGTMIPSSFVAVFATLHHFNCHIFLLKPS